LKVSIKCVSQLCQSRPYGMLLKHKRTCSRGNTLITLLKEGMPLNTKPQQIS